MASTTKRKRDSVGTSQPPAKKLAQPAASAHDYAESDCETDDETEMSLLRSYESATYKQMAEGNYGEAAKDLETVLKFQRLGVPETGYIYLQLAEAKARVGKVDEAIRILHSDDDAKKPFRESELGRKMVVVGEHLLERGEFFNCWVLLRTASKKRFPEDIVCLSDLYLLRAKALWKLEKLEQGLKCGLKALSGYNNSCLGKAKEFREKKLDACHHFIGGLLTNLGREREAKAYKSLTIRATDGQGGSAAATMDLLLKHFGVSVSGDGRLSGPDKDITRVIEAIMGTCDVELLDRLLMYWDLNEPLPAARKRPLLHVAISNGSGDIIRRLITLSADVNATSANGQTALHIAAGYDHELAAEILLSNGAIVDGSGLSKESPLHLAVHHYRSRVTKKLLEAGADANAVAPSDKSTPLLRAVGNSSSGEINPAVLMLLFHGVDVNVKDGQGMTALHHVVRSCRPDVAYLLIRYGADPEIKNDQGKRRDELGDNRAIKKHLLAEALKLDPGLSFHCWNYN